MYWHEQAERKPNVNPMNTAFPTRSLFQHNMKLYLQQRNLAVDVAEYNGWYESMDAGDNYRRVVIPAVTHKLGHAYWQARDIFGKAFIRYQCPKGPRHEALVAVKPIADAKGNVVVEGPMDALAAAQAGYAGIALMGMQPNLATKLHVALLLDSDLNTIVLLDRDSKGHGASVTMFLASNGLRVINGWLPGPEKDLAECLPKKRSSELQRLFRLFN